VVAIVLVAVAIALAVSHYTSPPRRNISPVNACVNNLRQLGGAAEQWRLEFGKATNAIPTMGEASRYMKYPPTCIGGGSYLYDTNTGLPTCTIPGHVFP